MSGGGGDVGETFVSISRLISATMVALFCGFGALAQTSTYPDRPIHLVVAFPPGATNDVVARLLGDQMGALLGQTVVIDNRPGANGFIGAQAVKRAMPDGYTLLQANTSIMGINPSLFKELPYDPVNDFEPISVIAVTPSVIVINPTVKARTLAELIAYAKQNPGKLSFGSAGTGTPMHLSMEMLKVQTGAQITAAGQAGFNNNWGSCCARAYDLAYTDDAPYFQLQASAFGLDLDASLREDSVKASGWALGGVTGPNTLVADNLGSATLPSLVAGGQQENLDYRVNYTSYSFGALYNINSSTNVFARISRGGRFNADREIRGGNFNADGTLNEDKLKAIAALRDLG